MTTKANTALSNIAYQHTAQQRTSDSAVAMDTMNKSK